MFTGIVEELGTVAGVSPVADGMRIEIAASTVLVDATLGASIAVNGCCLTVVERSETTWSADVQAETMRRTTLGTLSPGAPVNLERPLELGDRLGGHLVSGHVDATGEVVGTQTESDDSVRMRIRMPARLARYVIEKGSITVDGVSLTVAQTFPDGCAVALIPHTLAVTTLGRTTTGDVVNLEADMIAKYVERLVAPMASVTDSLAAPRSEQTHT